MVFMINSPLIFDPPFSGDRPATEGVIPGGLPPNAGCRPNPSAACWRVAPYPANHAPRDLPLFQRIHKERDIPSAACGLPVIKLSLSHGVKSNRMTISLQGYRATASSSESIFFLSLKGCGEREAGDEGRLERDAR